MDVEQSDLSLSVEKADAVEAAEEDNEEDTVSDGCSDTTVVGDDDVDAI